MAEPYEVRAKTFQLEWIRLRRDHRRFCYLAELCEHPRNASVWLMLALKRHGTLRKALDFALSHYGKKKPRKGTKKRRELEVGDLPY